MSNLTAPATTTKSNRIAAADDARTMTHRVFKGHRQATELLAAFMGRDDGPWAGDPDSPRALRLEAAIVNFKASKGLYWAAVDMWSFGSHDSEQAAEVSAEAAGDMEDAALAFLLDGEDLIRKALAEPAWHSAS